MKRDFSFRRFLHKDKLMMLISLILAIIIWYLTVYERGVVIKDEIKKVPVVVELGEYATDKIGLKIVSGGNTTVSVTVKGPRSVIGKLTADNITVKADTSGVYESGDHTVPLQVFQSGAHKGDYEIVNVSGGGTIEITCDIWLEKEFPLTPEQVDMQLTLSDTTKMDFDTVSISGEGIEDGHITAYGPQSAINRIREVRAVIPDTKELSKTEHFIADLIAYDADDRPVEGITFLNTKNDRVTVTVPVVVYRQENFAVTGDIPAGLKGKVALSPTVLELGELPATHALDAYLEDVRNRLLAVNLDQWKAENGKILTKEVALPEKDGVYLDRATDKTFVITLDVKDYTNKKVSIPLALGKNVDIQCAKGFTAILNSQQLRDVVLCGPKSVLTSLSKNLDDITFVIDMTQETGEGRHKVKVRPQLPQDSAWVFYGEAEGSNEYEVEITLTKK